MSSEEVAPLDPEVDAILARPKLERSVGAPPELTPEEQIRLENLAFAEYLGTGEEPAAVVRGRPEEARARAATEGEFAATRPNLAIEVVWGDVTKVVADVYTVGHYDSVLPQNAEFALDKAVHRRPRGSRTTTREASSSPSTRAGGTFAPR